MWKHWVAIHTCLIVALLLLGILILPTPAMAQQPDTPLSDDTRRNDAVPRHHPSSALTTPAEREAPLATTEDRWVEWWRGKIHVERVHFSTLDKFPHTERTHYVFDYILEVDDKGYVWGDI